MTFRSKIMAAGNSAFSAREVGGTAKTAVVAVGTNQATALQLSDTWNAITTSSASTGLLLPAAEEGAWVFIYNLSGQTLQIYAHETSGVTMNNAVAGSTGVQLGNTKTGIFFCDAYNHWVGTCALTST